MCNYNDEQLIRKVVNDLVAKEFMFTAFYVTKLIRLNREKVIHHDVQHIVKIMFANGEIVGYTREIKDIGAPVAPFVYYPLSCSLEEYDKEWIINNPLQKI
jgi:hypothetical protein